ncbi:uncharacterized protein BJ171DRAFT_22004 [Polychytrium aggregatum]|uniref:uncharacterized protein n=1 Tax=Polychytrium aggregatum TaxID=110093 RepID=UPI0022FF0957|nr:uncharacterized protein BJ171DRAFT_22004 [Polychytrium aggregatum]KAI9193027.1 hypothetical protein BJ171DRAFT_22004 [Polychytrium aggregatum]
MFTSAADFSTYHLLDSLDSDESDVDPTQEPPIEEREKPPAPLIECPKTPTVLPAPQAQCNRSARREQGSVKKKQSGSIGRGSSRKTSISRCKAGYLKLASMFTSPPKPPSTLLWHTIISDQTPSVTLSSDDGIIHSWSISSYISPVTLLNRIANEALADEVQFAGVSVALFNYASFLCVLECLHEAKRNPRLFALSYTIPELRDGDDNVVDLDRIGYNMGGDYQLVYPYSDQVRRHHPAIIACAKVLSMSTVAGTLDRQTTDLVQWLAMPCNLPWVVYVLDRVRNLLRFVIVLSEVEITEDLKRRIMAIYTTKRNNVLGLFGIDTDETQESIQRKTKLSPQSKSYLCEELAGFTPMGMDFTFNARLYVPFDEVPLSVYIPFTNGVNRVESVR